MQVDEKLIPVKIGDVKVYLPVDDICCMEGLDGKGDDSGYWLLQFSNESALLVEETYWGVMAEQKKAPYIVIDGMKFDIAGTTTIFQKYGCTLALSARLVKDEAAI